MLAELERRGLVEAVITQNVDRLHERAGSVNVIEVHGSLRTSSCLDCGHSEPFDRVVELLPVPRCERCGAVLKPDVVMFGELLPEEAIDRSFELARGAGLFLVVGSSLEVYPVAGLPDEALAAGAALAIVNRGPTPYDSRADLKIDGGAAETLSGRYAAARLTGRSWSTRPQTLHAWISTSYGTPSRWRITRRSSSLCRCSRLIAILDDNMSVKLVPVVVLLAAALAVVPATAFPARAAGKKTCHAGVLHQVGTATAAYAALVKSEARVFRKPGGAELKRFAKLNENGYPTTFGLVGAVLTRTCAASWYRVQLPMRPNGVIGYVRPADVLVQRVTAWIDVDLSARELRFFTRPQAAPEDAGRRRFARHADAGRPLLRRSADRHDQPERAVRPGRARRLRVLERPDGLGAGRADRHPRHERALVDRPCGLERLHPRPERDAEAALLRDDRRRAGRDPPVAVRTAVW